LIELLTHQAEVFHVNLVIALESYEYLVLLCPPSKLTWPDYKDGFYYHPGRTPWN